MRRAHLLLVLAVMVSCMHNVPGPASAGAIDPDRSGTAVNRPELPVIAAGLEPPTMARVVLCLHAQGTQNYECSEKNGASAWSAPVPDATLYEGSHESQVAGAHSAGPRWQANDGSAVVGDKASIVKASVDPGSIPWLLIRAQSASATGTLSNIAWIQRVNTRGGLETGACGAKDVGTVDKVPYSATYCFYSP